MAFEIGKIYKTRNGIEYEVVATSKDGRLIVDRIGQYFIRGLRYRNADGTFDCGDTDCNGTCQEWDLIDDSPTEKERETLARICETFGVFRVAASIRNKELGVSKAVEVLREATR